MEKIENITNINKQQQVNVEDKFWNATLILTRNLGSVYKKITNTIEIRKYKIVQCKKNLKLLNSVQINENQKYDKEDNIIQHIENQIQNICYTETIAFTSTEKEIGDRNDDYYAAAADDDGNVVSTTLITGYFRNEINRKSIRGLVFIKKLLLKSSSKVDLIYCLQVIDFIHKTVTQICLSDCDKNLKDKLSFEIKLTDDATIIEENSSSLIEINLNYHPSESNNREIIENWFKYVLQPKFLKWMNTIYQEDKFQISSHRLIDSEKFSFKYKALKEKYGDYLVKSWTESTDPKKFVYEDISIATYLIMLWDKFDDKSKINFVDLGCGNGLLVYLLNSEGYSGYGIDIKRRKIWDKYPSTIKLIEQKIDPITFKLENNINWIIGNHSDELSAWIPIISSQNSFDTKYFLLPCCAYELSGKKFQRRNTKMSVYMDFIKYCEQLSKNECKYDTILDRLKIPSTKRIALIGTKRTYPNDSFQMETDHLKMFITNQLNENLEKIIFREKEQTVRNCTQINKNIVDKIVLKIFKILLNDNTDAIDLNDHNDDGKVSSIKYKSYDDSEKSQQQFESWNSGTSISISDLIKYLHKDELKILKSECGGIKTLLKNHHQIFLISCGNMVSIKCPKIKMTNINLIKNDKMTYKKRKCFFYYNHPNGCPLNNDQCTFRHDEDVDEHSL